MSATPIPRTMMMSLYGDMDISKINEKPAKRKPTQTFSKPEKKIDELWPFINKQIKNHNQIFWVCPLIEESTFLDYSSAKKKYDLINNKIHTPCFLPLPTLPRNWCNCARPNLLAFSIIIKLALGKSIPTSITVVETKIKISLFRNLFRIMFFSSLSNAPCISPTLFGNRLFIISYFFFADV